MSRILIVLCLLISTLVSAQVGNNTDKGASKTYTLEALEAQKLRMQGDKSIPVVTDAELEERLVNISHQFPMKYNSLVKSHIKAYTERRRSSTETIIGRASIYFSIFENALSRHNVPTDLKYLAIVESALDPKATSPVGAKGLWQFMSSTGRRYGLRINKYVDERSDPYMSSDAAARYLADLYERYDDWALAIAAYNCGPGNVNKAIKRAGSKDFWRIKNYLPRETRNYVPAFIAVAYTMNYYHLHNIYPEYPEYDLQVTDHMKMYESTSLKKVAEQTDMSYETLQFLNPSFLRNFVPASTEGYVITLPLTKLMAFKAAFPNAKHATFSFTPTASLEDRNFNNTLSNVKYEQVESTYTVRKGDNLIKIAKQYNCKVNDIREWNGISGSLLRVGQKLTVFETRIVEHAIEAPVISPPVATTATPMNSTHLPTETIVAQPQKVQAIEEVVLYEVQRGDSVWKIASKFDNVNPTDIISWNSLNGATVLQPGKQLTIKVKR